MSYPTVTAPGTNMPGRVRQCEDPNCTDYIPCPNVRCQKHRKDFAQKDNTIPSYPEDKVVKVPEEWRNGIE